MSAASKTARKSLAAFTLIELLVVIGIIAILAALLLPALARAKARALQLDCKSNLKQMSYAIQMYAQDYAESLPGPAWQGIFFTYQDQNANWPSGDPYLDKYYGSLVAQLTSYLGYHAPDYQTRTAAVTICSASFKALPKIQAFPPLQVPISYFTQSPITNDPDASILYPFGRPDSVNPVLPKKLPIFRHPADQWALTDCDLQYVNGLGIMTATYITYIPKKPVHGSIIPALRNYMYFDGHVESQKTPF
jgi:prepilin-type N-terminal cleavage/methylation domain-containing protein/prepilin-type processing-associated H-X9-DG protein